jgi:hypothetical protein
VLHVLESSLVRKQSWCRDLAGVPPDADDPGAVPSVVRDALIRQARDLSRAATAIDDRDLQRAWCLHSTRPRDAARSPDASAAEIGRRDRLRVADGGFSYVVAPLPDRDEDAVFIYRAGIEWLFPAQAHDFVRALARADMLHAEDVLQWDENQDWPAAVEVLRQLLVAGILTRVS